MMQTPAKNCFRALGSHKLIEPNKKTNPREGRLVGYSTPWLYIAYIG